MVGIVTGYDPQTGMAKVVQKNRFFKGSQVEFLRPVGRFFTQTIRCIQDAAGNELEVANRPQSVVYVRTDQPVEPDTFLRQERK